MIWGVNSCRLIMDDNGDFTSPYMNRTLTVDYLEDLCEWYYHTDRLTDVERYKNIFDIEMMVHKHFRPDSEIEKTLTNYKFESFTIKAAKKLLKNEYKLKRRPRSG
jgi:hypothetical protein